MISPHYACRLAKLAPSYSAKRAQLDENSKMNGVLSVSNTVMVGANNPTREDDRQERRC